MGLEDVCLIDLLHFWLIYTGNFVGTARMRNVGSQEKAMRLLWTPFADAAADESVVRTRRGFT